MVLEAPPSFPSQPRLNIDWPVLSAVCYVRAKVIIHAHRAQNVLSTLQRCGAIQASVPKSWYVSVNFRHSSRSSLSLLPSRSGFPGLCYISSHLEKQNKYLVFETKICLNIWVLKTTKTFAEEMGITSRLWVQFPLVAWWVENPFSHFEY